MSIFYILVWIICQGIIKSKIKDYSITEEIDMNVIKRPCITKEIIHTDKDA